MKPLPTKCYCPCGERLRARVIDDDVVDDVIKVFCPQCGKESVALLSIDAAIKAFERDYNCKLLETLPLP